MNITKTLGLVWEPHRDRFLFTFARHNGSEKHTLMQKCKMLSFVKNSMVLRSTWFSRSHYNKGQINLTKAMERQVATEWKFAAIVGDSVLLDSDCSEMSLGFKYINSFGSMQRIFGYVYKFINRFRSPNITVENVRRGTDILIRTVQKAQLVSEYKALQKKKAMES